MELQSYYNTVAEKYFAHAQRLPDSVLDIFLSYLPNGASILDTGCGPGNETEYFRSRGFDATGIDASEEMVRIARKEFPEGKYEVADMRGYLPEHLFDGVWCSAVLMHFDASERSNIIHSYIFPGARTAVGIVVPFGDDGEMEKDTGVPFHRFDEDRLRAELAHPDWEIASLERIELKSPWLMAISVRRNA